jgi:hypothetical protein
MLHRWGPNVKEMMAIKKYLATQNISFNHPPWVRCSQLRYRYLKILHHLETLRSYCTIFLLINKTIEKSAMKEKQNWKIKPISSIKMFLCD